MASSHLLQALNVLMLKILENSNRNHCFAALMQLCLEAPEELIALGVPEAQTRWADLVVKCLIKITKALPATIEVRRARAWAHCSVIERAVMRLQPRHFSWIGIVVWR